MNDLKLFELTKYLDRKGWFISAAGTPQDVNGAVPWITYPALSMLIRLIRPEFNVFEFGCGSSTIWWSKRVRSVVAVDHNLKWVENTRAKVSDNVVINHRGKDYPTTHDLKEFFQAGYQLPMFGKPAMDVTHGLLCREFTAYAATILAYPMGHFDLVVVDGMARTLTAWLAARQLGSNGIILFDNTDRWQYNSAYQLLIDAGFMKLDFWGIGPVQTNEWCTSIFVRNPEVLKQNSLIPIGQSDLGW